MIRISAKQDGFRRCGIAHSKTATEHQDDVFTPEQLAVLQNEPMLVVEILPDPDDKDKGDKSKKKGSEKE